MPLCQMSKSHLEFKGSTILFRCAELCPNSNSLVHWRILKQLCITVNYLKVKITMTWMDPLWYTHFSRFLNCCITLKGLNQHGTTALPMKMRPFNDSSCFIYAHFHWMNFDWQHFKTPLFFDLKSPGYKNKIICSLETYDNWRTQICRKMLLSFCNYVIH